MSLTIESNHLETLQAAAAGSAESITYKTAVAADLTPQVTKELLRVLATGGALTVTVETASPALKRALLFAGFSGVTVDGITATAAKPGFKVGASEPLKAAEAAAATSTWTLSGDGGLVDEDALLEKDAAAPAAPVYDCGTSIGVRKACKDCSCGLAEELEGETRAAAGGERKSGCGSCSLGDAFRCANCPSLGLPAWKTDSETVKLQL